MMDLDAYLAFQRNEFAPCEPDEPVYCAWCEEQIHPDDVGEYTDAQTNEPVCGAC